MLHIRFICGIWISLLCFSCSTGESNSISHADPQGEHQDSNGDSETEIHDGEWDWILEDESYDETLIIDEPDKRILIRNCQFQNTQSHGLVIRHALKIRVENCSFTNIGDMGILLPAGGYAENVVLSRCTMENVGVHGIHAAQRSDGTDYPNLTIDSCSIMNSGTAHVWMGHDHGIYVQSSNFTIENNLVAHSLSGHGISVRSSGVIRNNITYNNYGSGIDYFNDHPGAGDSTLLIENNICWDDDSTADQSSRGLIDLVYDINNPDYCLDTFIIRYNTAVSSQAGTYSIDGNSQFLERDLSIYGNLLINTQDDSYIPSNGFMDNYFTQSLDHFSNTVIQPYDFHLTQEHPARNVGSGTSLKPEKDIDGQQRSDGNPDYGADEY